MTDLVSTAFVQPIAPTYYQSGLFTDRRPARPIIKWAGGKSRLLKQFDAFFPAPASYERYFEPFLGGAAIFFQLQPPDSYLFDLNSDLIELYTMVRDQVEGVIDALAIHHNERSYFNAIRAQDTAALSSLERAARFIFLNRTCYNGLYRVNSKGQFNVPFGRYTKPPICNAETLRAASKALRTVHLSVSDFEASVAHCQHGDFIYFDPPYAPLSATSSFISYTKQGFDADDQRRLADLYRELDRRGCLLMLSNSSAPLVYELYAGFALHEIEARRAINSRGNGRGTVTELLVTNFTR